MSIREQILKAVIAAGKPLTVKEIFAVCGEAETVAQIAQGCYQTAHLGFLKPVKGEGGTRYEITPNGVTSTIAGTSGGGRPLPAKKPQRGPANHLAR